MSEASDIMVNTNVLLDVVEADPIWQEWSLTQMSQFPGRLIINPMIYTELSYRAEGIEDVERLIASLGLKFQELPREALFLAAKAYKAYRKRGGTQTAPPADFLIGAHAAVLEVPLLTRDVARYRTNF